MWTSAVRSITPSNGLFTVILGESPDPTLLSAILSAAATIGVTVGSDLEMTPRQPVNTVAGHCAASAGVIGGSNTGIGVYGKSNTGAGLYGYSSTGAGLSANSNGGGNVNAAIVANNTLTTTGMAGFFSNHSNYPAVQIGNSGNGKAGEFINNGSYPSGSFRNDGTGSVLDLYNGSGPFLNSFDQAMDNVFQVKSNGDVVQSRYANGLVKAAANVFCSNAGSKVDSYFNPEGNTVTVTNGEDMGHCVIDFHFDLTNHYYSAMVTSDVPAGTNCLIGGNATTLICYVYHFNPTDTYLEYGEISVVVY